VPREKAGELHALPASLWRRQLAFLVDALAVTSIVLLYLMAATTISGLKGHPAHLSGIDAVMLRAHALERVLLPGLGLGAVLALLYATLFGFLWQGRTPGRRLLGIRLVDQSGLPPTPIRASLRAVLSLLSFALFLGGFWLALFDRRGQTLHDKLTSTFVIRPI
jgi:uncharacterized RDD family membrane protein YckC